jgi:hypothetical protein
MATCLVACSSSNSPTPKSWEKDLGSIKEEQINTNINQINTLMNAPEQEEIQPVKRVKAKKFKRRY